MAVEALPRWDLTTVFPGPDSAECRAAMEGLAGGIAELGALFDEHGVGRREPAPLDEGTVGAVEAAVGRYNAVLESLRVLDGFLYCAVEGDARDEAAKAAFAELRQRLVPLAQLEARFVAWVGSLDVEGLIGRSAVARAHAYALRRAQRAAAHQMGPGEEALAAELAPAGGAAWGRLRHELAARLTVRLEVEGEEKELPMSEVENLGFHPDRGVRRRAHEAERGGWRSQALVFAAAINGVKGETATLAERRGWDDPLDAALFESAIDRPTLEALMGAVAEALPDYRRYLRAKARLLGLPVLGWYDLGAPVGTPRPWPWAEAEAFVAARFAEFSPKLAALARRATAERWIDAGPREGKSGGGFCAAIRPGESRILLNYAPTYLWLSALAHELGHAYHGAVRGEFGLTPLQNPYPGPMTLAETASTFCEELVGRAALARADAGEELAILDGTMQAVSGNVFGTAVMFAFEREVFAARRRRELSVEELDGLMLAAQREVFGDAVDPDGFFPETWEGVPHFFLDGLWYYNFPYAFGMLFGRGLWARYEADPDGFRAGFDDLLTATGMAEAAELAGRFGIDLRSAGFWRTSLDGVRVDVDRYEALAGRYEALAGRDGAVVPAGGAPGAEGPG